MKTLTYTCALALITYAGFYSCSGAEKKLPVEQTTMAQLSGDKGPIEEPMVMKQFRGCKAHQ